MRRAFVVVFFLVIASKAVCGDKFAEEAADHELTVAMPVHNEHFMDYVIALVDEFAPDASDGTATAKEREEAAVATLTKDESLMKAAKSALGRATQKVKLESMKAHRTKDAAKFAKQTSKADAKKVQKMHDQAEADNQQSQKDEAKAKAAEKKVEKDKATAIKDKAALAKYEKEAEHDAKVAHDKRQEAEATEKKEIDAKAAEDKDKVTVQDDMAAVEQAKLKEQVDKVELKKATQAKQLRSEDSSAASSASASASPGVLLAVPNTP